MGRNALAEALEAEMRGAASCFARSMAIQCVTPTRFLAALAMMPGREARDELRKACPEFAHLCPELA